MPKFKLSSGRSPQASPSYQSSKRSVSNSLPTIFTMSHRTLAGLLSLAVGSFNILVYTGQDTEVPNQWQEDDAHMISGTAEQVRLRSFATSVHKVDALVAYRLGED